MGTGETLVKDLIWVGDSLEVLRSFPEKVKDEMGFALHSIQMGSSPLNSKPFKGFPGVFEIMADNQGNTYRAVYALKIGKHVYVLHSFQKKSKSGIKTPQREIDLIKTRFKAAKRMEEEYG